MLVAHSFHEMFEVGTLLSGGWKMGQAGKTAEVAVAVAAEFESSWAVFSQVGGGVEAELLFFGQRLVGVFPCGEDFVTGLRGAGG